MKIALTFLTLAVLLLFGSLMWGMKTYTDLAHARANIDRLQQEVSDLRQAAFAGINPIQPSAAQVPVATTPPPPEPGISQAEMEAKLERMFAEREAQQQREEARVSDLEAEIRAMELVSSQQDDELNILKTEREGAEEPDVVVPLSVDQNRIAQAPVLATVTKSEPKHGFVVLDAGSNKNINVGAQFSLRRGHLVIGKIRVLDPVEENECVADIITGSVPAGAEVKPGDEVIGEFVGS